MPVIIQQTKLHVRFTHPDNHALFMDKEINIADCADQAAIDARIADHERSFLNRIASGMIVEKANLEEASAEGPVETPAQE